MKVGFDGMLLGAWADVQHCGRILDVGTGTGLVALMLAQRTEAPAALDKQPVQIDAVEIDPAAAAEAAANVGASPWAQRISVTRIAFQELPPRASYDLVVCNPPYFAAGIRSARASRAIARHADALSWEVLCAKSGDVLRKRGRLVVILPSQGLDGLQAMARHGSFFIRRLTHVRPTPSKPPHRVLLELRREAGPTEVDQLTLEQHRHCYAADFRELTRDFYLSL